MTDLTEQGEPTNGEVAKQVEPDVSAAMAGMISVFVADRGVGTQWDMESPVFSFSTPNGRVFNVTVTQAGE